MKVKALQFEPEINRLCEIIRREAVASYLEIGSKFGGSLWRVAHAMPKGSRVVAVDLPSPTHLPTESRRSLEEVIGALIAEGYDAHVVWGDSTAPETIAAVNALGPFDCAFIDGDHTRKGVEADWENYGKAAKMAAFHDIAWSRPADFSGYDRIDAPQVWAEIKGGHRHEEIKLDKTGRDNGIGVLWL